MKKYLLSLLIGFVFIISFCNAEIVCIDSESESYVDCPVACELTGENWSSLFINDIQHLGAGIINITIPEEIFWDYTGNDEEFDLFISGYNVDSQYIAGIIDTQTTKPNEVDFNNVVSGLLPLFIPGLVVLLFLYFVFRFIKKIF